MISEVQTASAAITTTNNTTTSMTTPPSSSSSPLSSRNKEYVYDHYENHHVPRNASHVMVQSYCRSIGWRAFDGCIYLRHVSFEGVEELKIIHSLAFWGCTSLRTMMQIPSSVIRIDEAAFEKCTALRNVCLPDGLQHIADSTFYGCTSLEFIEIPPMVRKIGKFAFAYCQALREIQIPSSTPSSEGGGGGRLGVIGSCAFMKCTCLAKAILPSTVFSIGQSAFEGCTQLEQVILGHGEWLRGTKAAPLNIHTRAFQNCVQLTLIKLPKSLRVMDKTAFSNCPKLTQLDLPPSFQLKSFQNGWPLIKQVLLASVPTYSVHQSILWNELKQVCARGKSAFRKQRVYALAKQMRDCRRIEITSLLELALWKKAILSEKAVIHEDDDEDEKKMMMVDRTNCRITCGAHVVMQRVVGYLQPISNGATKSSCTTATCSIRPWNVSEF